MPDFKMKIFVKDSISAKKYYLLVQRMIAPNAIKRPREIGKILVDTFYIESKRQNLCHPQS